MASNFKTRFWKISRWFALLFVLMFIFRLTYGYLSTDTSNGSGEGENYFENLGRIRKNYASEKGSKKEHIQADSRMASNQKYEKTASIKSKTAEFDKDQRRLKEKTKSYNGVIQYEQSLGQKGDRQIHMMIGVDPELFDSLYAELKEIGSLKATIITKVDKTNEYRQLNAQKASIEKTLQSLNELKAKGGEIADFVALNEKILEIEEKAQSIGVELGNFDTENEFCTIIISLYEGATQKSISLTHRIKVALEWTIKYFAALTASLLILALSIFVGILIVDKLKLMTTFNQKINE